MEIRQAVEHKRLLPLSVAAAGLIGASLFDAETTVQGMRQGMVEGNPVMRPLMGSTGNRARVYVAAAVPTAVALVAANELQKRGHSAWWIPPVVGTVAHLVAGSLNKRRLK